jgi:predicted aminopeptidase
MRSFYTLSAVVTMTLVCSSCYLSQSIQGQLKLMSQRQPMDRVIADPHTSAAVRSQLSAVTEIRDFSSHQLRLPNNGSYRSYADVGRPYVVWNVFAAPEFSLQPRQWCYPVVGCVAYRGYFSERRARDFAQTLRTRGMDVSVGGVAAYSTLGHFNDPVLNTMLGWSDVQLASIIFHELTHQLLYIPGDAPFNEALASTVEEEGVRRWLKSQGREKDLQDYALQKNRYDQVVALLIDTRHRLLGIYNNLEDAATMRAKKAEAFAALQVAFERLKAGWGGRAPLDYLFRAQINNADLISVETYRSCVPGFERELAAAGGDLGVFYARVRQLAKLTPDARDALLECRRMRVSP